MSSIILIYVWSAMGRYGDRYDGWWRCDGDEEAVVVAAVLWYTMTYSLLYDIWSDKERGAGQRPPTPL